MCDKPIQAFLLSEPNPIYGFFSILTRQYREVVQINKEYIVFPSKIEKYRKRFFKCQEVFVPCGKCIQCLYSRSKSYEIRAIFQNLTTPNSMCLTLTYDDDHLPTTDEVMYDDDKPIFVRDELRGVFIYKGVQDFIKRVRMRFKFRRKISYLCSCEFGCSRTGTLRPHYHLIIYGCSLADLGENPEKLSKRRSKKGTLLYKSPVLDKLWGHGFVDVGKVDLRACRYISQYCCKGLLKERQGLPKYMKKVLDWKRSITKECVHSSQGLGLDFFKAHYRTFVSSGKIVYGKFTYAIPRYFINKLEQINLKMFQNVKQKARDYWLRFKLTPDVLRQLKIRTENLLDKLNLFHSELPLLT